MYGTDSNLKPLHHLWKKMRSADFNVSYLTCTLFIKAEVLSLSVGIRSCIYYTILREIKSHFTIFNPLKLERRHLIFTILKLLNTVIYIHTIFKCRWYGFICNSSVVLFMCPSDQMQGTVTLRNISTSTSGLYQCTSSNAIGKSTCVLNVQVVARKYCQIHVFLFL